MTATEKTLYLIGTGFFRLTKEQNMEWLIGLLIGVAWGAGFSSFVHWAHEQEKAERLEKADRIAKCQDKRIIEPKVKQPWYVPAPEPQEVVAKFEDIPDSCICDWDGEQALCDAEPQHWYLGRKDPQCDVHRSNDAWLLRYYANRPGGY